jgi:hypothetical protein
MKVALNAGQAVGIARNDMSTKCAVIVVPAFRLSTWTGRNQEVTL